MEELEKVQEEISVLMKELTTYSKGTDSYCYTEDRIKSYIKAENKLLKQLKVNQ